MEKLGDYTNMDAETLRNAAALIDLLEIRIKNESCSVILYDTDTNDLISLSECLSDVLYSAQYIEEEVKHVGVKVINEDSFEVSVVTGDLIEPAHKILKVV